MNTQAKESSMSNTGIRALQDLLSDQAGEVQSLSKELAASYEKEIVFFNSLSRRDLQMEKQQLQSRKTIRQLESERSNALEALASAEKQIILMRKELETVIGQRDALRASWGGRMQRAYWRALRKIRRGGRA